MIYTIYKVRICDGSHMPVGWCWSLGYCTVVVGVNDVFVLVWVLRGRRGRRSSFLDLFLSVALSGLHVALLKPASHLGTVLTPTLFLDLSSPWHLLVVVRVTHLTVE